MTSLIVDLFAGGGGASVGLERALGRVDLAINHDWDALRVHRANHPRTRHLVEDIREVVPLVATRGRHVDVLWASPDCKHFSRCKGGKPLDQSIRLLPWQVVRWARDTQPRLIAMENVPEFLTWGPLDDEEHPIPEAKGTTFAAWVAELRELGYDVAWRVLKACSYGTPTSRQRLFVVARRDGGRPSWPAPTHGPGTEQPYRAAAECIDWSDLGSSIFDRPRPLAPATCRRIARGVVKFVIEAERPFMVPGQDAAACLVSSGYGERPGQAPRVLDLRQPMGTVVAGGVKRRLVTAFISKHYGGVTGHGLRRPLGTITTVDHHGLTAVELGGAGDRAPRVAAFLSTYFGQSVGRAVDQPMPTQTTRDRFALVTVQIDGQEHVLTDIYTRMLQPHELKLAQGFPADYRLDVATKRTQVRLIGNSVPPQLSEAVVRANTPSRARVAVM